MKVCWKFRLTIRSKCTYELDSLFVFNIQIIYLLRIGLLSIIFVAVSCFNSREDSNADGMMAGREPKIDESASELFESNL